MNLMQWMTKSAQEPWSSFETPEARIREYNNNSETLHKVTPLAGLAAGYGLSRMAEGGILGGTPASAKDVQRMAEKYLGKDTIAVPVTGMGNASYVSVRVGDKKVHVIKYDPRVNKSVIAHEIGHGHGSQLPELPRVPLLDSLAASALVSGAAGAGQGLGAGTGISPMSLGLGLGGAAYFAPRLYNEWQASSSARKIMREEGEKPRGLNRAFATYALPAALAAGIGGLQFARGRSLKNWADATGVGLGVS